MTGPLLASLCAFSIVTSVTPGPNNLMLLASGVSFGFRRSLPHTIGISLGFFVLLLATGFGLGALLTAYPMAQHGLGIFGEIYLIYLAYRIATRGSVSGAHAPDKKPMTLFQAAMFQWINPKAWFMALTGMALYADAQKPFVSIAIVALVFALLNWPCVLLWAALGVSLRNFFDDPRHLRWFNRLMAVLLIGSLLVQNS
ncbi:LysE family translocator [Acidocella sp.]|jgi:threonine/homoserine/homoserine lactone efflux protein|uniref:LysE family translocator n=1 Tax=Acidocella sp. TaxID=50710 RepID=UPI002F41C1A5